MFKPVSIAASNVGRAPQGASVSIVNSVFKVLHGAYGNLFLSKFSTGALVDKPGTPEHGQDKGIISARQVWAHGLRDYDVATVQDALLCVVDQFAKFPPNMGEFVAICRACKPREIYAPQVPAIPMSQELQSARAASNRAIVEKYRLRHVEKMEALEPPTGLDALMQAIGNAVATAGGDEGAALRRLDTMFTKRAA